MSDPSLALQGAIVTALRADTGLQALVGQRVLDHVSATSPLPYVTVGDGHVVGDDTEDCGDGSDVTVQIDVWTQEPGFKDSKTIAGIVRTALRGASFSLSGFRIVSTQFVQTQYMHDPDGVTRHAVVEFRYLITHTT